MPRETIEVLPPARLGKIRVNNNTLTSKKQNGFRDVRFATYSVVKRVFDLVISATVLVILSPVFVVVAVAIKIDSKGPVLFRQNRTGKDGRIFKMYKFRSMVADNDVLDASCGDKYTRVGKFIRRTSLDELPQFINVFLGQMSFIGPRPWIHEYWTNMNEEERMRARVRPGITGLAAAKGRNGLTVFEKIAYDLEYVRNFSLLQDIKVILLTFRQLLRSEEVSVGKAGIHNEIDELKVKDKGPMARIIVKSDPWASVVVPLKNGEEYISEIVGVASGRDCRKMELVVVNEDRIDEAERIMEKFSPERIKITRSADSGRKLYEMLDGENGRFLCVVESRGVR